MKKSRQGSEESELGELILWKTYLIGVGCAGNVLQNIVLVGRAGSILSFDCSARHCWPCEYGFPCLQPIPSGNSKVILSARAEQGNAKIRGIGNLGAALCFSHITVVYQYLDL